jgi:hypothetical protein
MDEPNVLHVLTVLLCLLIPANSLTEFDTQCSGVDMSNLGVFVRLYKPTSVGTFTVPVVTLAGNTVSDATVSNPSGQIVMYSDDDTYYIPPSSYMQIPIPSSVSTTIRNNQVVFDIRLIV